jgi:hypothetical protein
MTDRDGIKYCPLCWFCTEKNCQWFISEHGRCAIWFIGKNAGSKLGYD